MTIPPISSLNINNRNNIIPEIHSDIADLRLSNCHGISGIPSSMQSRMLANESGHGGICAGICSWLTNLFTKFHQWLSQFWGSSSSDAPTRSSLESIVEKANQIIDRHFNSQFIVDPANQQNSAIITILKFNGQMEMTCGITSNERNNVNRIKNLLRQLLTRGHEQNLNGRIDIETYLIKKDSNTWNYFIEDSHFHLSNDQSGGGFGSGDGLITLLQRLQVSINTVSGGQEARARIGAVIRQL